MKNRTMWLEMIGFGGGEMLGTPSIEFRYGWSRRRGAKVIKHHSLPFLPLPAEQSGLILSSRLV